LPVFDAARALVVLVGGLKGDLERTRVLRSVDDDDVRLDFVGLTEPRFTDVAFAALDLTCDFTEIARTRFVATREARALDARLLADADFGRPGDLVTLRERLRAAVARFGVTLRAVDLDVDLAEVLRGDVIILQTLVVF